ncbi:helix-turn-helix domain-containing protein, partial [Kineosporia rhizophila]|uniref:helix-turn-helix domain-containing protein n=1 Tax=Kineosporia rhizophila TaxID=84633 RepID=UPI001E2E9C07
SAQGYPNDAAARRFIGRTVNEAREALKMSLDQLAIEAEWTKSSLQRVEKADPHVRFKPRDFRGLLTALGVEDDFQTVLMGLAATLQSSQKGDASTEWWRQYIGHAVPAWFELYIRLEHEASLIRTYEAELIPGVLQVRSYAAEVIKYSLPSLYSDEEAEQRIEARMQRQTLLTRENPPHLSVILNEAVIRRTIGMGTDIARDQLEGLLKAGALPHVELRILAFEAGIHGGMTGAAGFSALTFPLLPGTDKPVERPMVYSDFTTGALYQSEPEDVASHNRVWDALGSKALDPRASEEAIRTALGELS